MRIFATMWLTALIGWSGCKDRDPSGQVIQGTEPVDKTGKQAAEAQPEAPPVSSEMPVRMTIQIKGARGGYSFTILPDPTEADMISISGCETRRPDKPCAQPNSLGIEAREFRELWSGLQPADGCVNKARPAGARDFVVRWATEQRAGFLPADPRRAVKPGELAGDVCNLQAPFVALVVAGFESADFNEGDETAD